MTVSDDKGFEVVDKRTGESAEDAEPETEPKAEAQPEVAETPTAEQHENETEESEHEHDHTHSPDVYTMVTWMIGMLASSAWQTMGLQVDPTCGEIRKNLEEAKIAIDCVMALADRILPHTDESVRRELRGVISDLQLNFVNQSKGS
jgi:hypothetical protein